MMSIVGRRTRLTGTAGRMASMIEWSLVVSCIAGCSRPVEPVEPSPPPGRPALAPPVPTDSLCRRVSFAFTGSNGIVVTFPDRAACPSGLVVIPGGTATRTGGGGKHANIPVRLLNRSGYAIQSPGAMVLAPADRVILAPSGQPGSKLTPQNHDSTRAGSWVWLVGSQGTVGANDSTSARTLILRLDSPATSAQVTLAVEAQLLSAGGWPLLAYEGPVIDVTKVATQPGTGVSVYRTAVWLTFQPSVTDQSKQAFFTQNSLTVRGVTTYGVFAVTFADPGPTYETYAAFMNLLRSKPEVATVAPYYRSDLKEHEAARYPSDSLKRVDWFSSSAGIQMLTWAMRAVRAPQAWGCETGAYAGSTLVPVGLVEWTHAWSHPELAASTPGRWEPADDSALVSQVVPAPVAKQDSARRHAAHTAGLLSASGDDGRGVAGVAWRSALQLYSWRSPAGRSLLPRHLNRFVAAVKDRRPRILSFSIDAFNADTSGQSRLALIHHIAAAFRETLDSVPGLLVSVAAGNEGNAATPAAYIQSQNAGVVRSAWLLLQSEPQYADRIIIAAGTRPGNAFWPGSNSYSGSFMLAPAESVMVMDTVTGGQVPILLESGTSLAAPLIAGAAALILATEPSLSASQVKDYLLRGAQGVRFDSATGQPAAPLPVQGVPNASLYQLDIYGALLLLSKERPGSPICGYPVSSGGPNNTWAMLEKNGPLQPPTDSIKVPGAGHPVSVISVAPGGRLLSAHSGIDSLNNGSQAVIQFSHLGQRLSAQANVYGGRHYVERYYADHRSVTGFWQEVTLRRMDGSVQAAIPQLKQADGTVVTTMIPEALDVSPDGRFVAFRTGGGTFVQRFADNTTTRIGDPGWPRWSKDGTRLVTLATIDTLLNHVLTVYRVDSTSHGGFTSMQTAAGTGRGLERGSRYSGDDAVLYTFEYANNPVRYFIARRAGSAVGTKAAEQQVSYSESRNIGNVAARIP